MKRTFFTALVALGFLLPMTQRANAQGKFEGTIVWAMTMPQLDEEKHDLIQSMKGDQTYTEMDLGAQGGMKMWIDRSANKMYMYMAALGNNGMVMDMPNDSVALAKAGDQVVDIKPTGKKATVAGHAAEEYLMTIKDGQMSLWMASDFSKDLVSAFQNTMSSGQKQDVKVTRAIKDFIAKGQVPVKMQVTSAGEIAMTMELQKIEAKKLDDKIFERPSNIKFGAMPAGMMGN
jgi:hypothetical protein